MVGLTLGSRSAVTALFALFGLVYSSDFYTILDPLGSSNAMIFGSDGQIVADGGRVAGEQVKLTVGLGIYAMTALLTLFHWRAVVGFHRRAPHFAVLLAVLLAGTTWSASPFDVVTSTVQIGVGLHIALLFALTHSDRSYPFADLRRALLLPMVLVHLASALIFFYHGLSTSDFWNGLQRFGGFAGNPNSLGGQCVVGVWLALSLLLDSRRGTRSTITLLGCLAVFGFTLSLTGSGTALLGSIAAIGATLLLHFVDRLSQDVRRVAMVGTVFLMVTGGITYLIFGGGDDLVERVATSVGKDATFTGRTELWTVAWEAIKERPWLGWSFDHHISVMETRQFAVPFGHYHNGFLDTLVAGGFVLGAIVLYELVKLVVMVLARQTHGDQRSAHLLLPLILLFMLNLSEYSLLRPLSSFYVLFQATWCIAHLRLRRR